MSFASRKETIPKLSVVVCTYNAPELVRNCLLSLLAQSYKNFEVLCVDGLSERSTVEVIEEFTKKDNRVKYIVNHKRLAEGRGNGKWLGFKMARGEIAGIVDQDNVLQDTNFLRKVVDLFQTKNKMLGVLGGMVNNLSDSHVVRFVSLFGTDPFFAYRSIDFHRSLSMKNSSQIQIFANRRNNLLLTGGNVFFYRKKDIENIGGYEQDILSVMKLVESGKTDVLILNDATKHYTEKNMWSFVKKLLFGKKYFEKGNDRFNYMPSTKEERKAFLTNILFNILLVPNFYYVLKIFKKSKDPVSFYFPFLAFASTIFYSLIYLREVI